MQGAMRDLISGIFWKHGMNVPRDVVEVIQGADGIVRFKVRTPDNSLSLAARDELNHLVVQDPKLLLAKVKVCLAGALELDGDHDSVELATMNMSREDVKRLLSTSAGTIAAVEDVGAPEVVGRITVGGMRSKVMAEHMDSLNATLSELCFQNGINARFKLSIDRKERTRRGTVKLKYEALTGDAFDGAKIQELLATVFDTSNKATDNLDGVEFIESFKKRVERSSGTDGMLALQRMKLVGAEAEVTKKLDDLEGAELTVTKPFQKARSRRSRGEAKATAADRIASPDRAGMGRLVKASELISATEVGDIDDAEVTKSRKRRERKSRKERRSRGSAGGDDAVSERRRRRGERRNKRGEGKKKSAEEKEQERQEAMKADQAAAAAAAKAEGVTLKGMFVLSGIDNDEITKNVKKHMVDAMLTTLVGLEATVTAENVNLKSVTSLSNGHQSVAFEIRVPGVTTTDPVLEQAKQRLKRGIERSSGRSFVGRMTRTLAKAGDVSLKFNTELAVESVGRIEVLGAAAKMASKTRLAPMRGLMRAVGAIGALKYMQRPKVGGHVPKDMAATHGSVSIGNLSDADYKTLRKVLKGVLVDVAYDLGLQTSSNNVNVDATPELVGAKAKFSFSVVLPQEDLAAGDVGQELQTELRNIMNDSERLVAALNRKAMELGCEGWANGPLTTHAGNVDDIKVADDTGTEFTLQEVLRAGRKRSSIPKLTALHRKGADMFTTLNGSVKLKKTSAREFNDSASMHRALKDSLIALLSKAGLDPQECRVKIAEVVDEDGGKCTVNYTIRLKAGAKAMAPRVAETLRDTFTERGNRQVFIDGFWKTAEKLDNRLQRRKSRRSSRSPISKLKAVSLAVSKGASTGGQDDEAARLSRPSVRRKKSRSQADAEGGEGGGAGAEEVVEKTGRRRERRSRRSKSGEGKSSRSERRSRRREKRDKTRGESKSAKSSPKESKSAMRKPAVAAVGEDFDAD